MDEEEKLQRYRRAKEVLDGAGWLFDDFVNAEMRKVMTSAPDDMTGREIAYNRARVAVELKKIMADEVAEYEGNELFREHREKMKERTNGTRVN